MKEPKLRSDQSLKIKKSDTYKISGYYDGDDSSCVLGYDTMQSGKCVPALKEPTASIFRVEDAAFSIKMYPRTTLHVSI
jgi:hypothetical protein